MTHQHQVGLTATLLLGTILVSTSCTKDSSSSAGDTEADADTDSDTDTDCGAYVAWNQEGRQWTWGMDHDAYGAGFYQDLEVVEASHGSAEWDGEAGHRVTTSVIYELQEPDDYLYWTTDEVRFCNGERHGVRYRYNDHAESFDGYEWDAVVEMVYTGEGEWKVDPQVGDSWEYDPSYDQMDEDGSVARHFDMTILTYTVVEEEEITTPAGTFDTLKVEIDNDGDLSHVNIAEGVGVIYFWNYVWLEQYEL